MSRRRSLTATCAVLTVFLMLAGCPAPISASRKLRAIKAEAELLVAGLPSKPPRDQFGIIPKHHWPPAIASLQPEYVTVHASRVHIVTRPYFDGGWGYEITDDKRNLGMLPDCYWEMIQGVFWHEPC